MVRFFFQYLLIPVLVTSSCALSSPSKRDAAAVQADVAALTTQAKAYEVAVNNFSSTSTLADALTIHAYGTKLVTSFNGATTDINALPLPASEGDATDIITAVEASEPTIIDAVHAFLNKEDLFNSVAFPIGGIPSLLRQDFSALNSSTSNFGVALINFTQADLKPRATAIKAAIDAAFGGIHTE